MPSNVFCEALNTSLVLKRRNAVVHLDSIVGTSLTRLCSCPLHDRFKDMYSIHKIQVQVDVYDTGAF